VIGWSTARHDYQAATSSLDVAVTFWPNAVSNILDWGVKIFAFEALDEPWKPVSVGQNGSVADETHCGV
jgi:glucan 1,3-beta-glucosidase